MIEKLSILIMKPITQLYMQQLSPLIIYWLSSGCSPNLSSEHQGTKDYQTDHLECSSCWLQLTLPEILSAYGCFHLQRPAVNPMKGRKEGLRQERCRAFINLALWLRHSTTHFPSRSWLTRHPGQQVRRATSGFHRRGNPASREVASCNPVLPWQ